MTTSTDTDVAHVRAQHVITSTSDVRVPGRPDRDEARGCDRASGEPRGVRGRRPGERNYPPGRGGDDVHHEDHADQNDIIDWAYDHSTR